LTTPVHSRRGVLATAAAATASGILGPSMSRAAGPERGAVEMDWMTMSLEARNLAYNDVAHVGLDLNSA
jgi:hypothetical protein